MNQSPSKDSQKSVWSELRENGQIVIIALVFAFLIRTFVAEPRYIPSDSMLPTLEQGDRLVVEKLSFFFHPPQPGDIVVFRPPDLLLEQGYTSDQAFIKRVIALPGETVTVNNGKVYIDQVPLLEDYILDPPQYNLPTVKVPPGYLFVMGDNRNNSNDSHVWGFLPQENLIGHAIFRFFPFNRFGRLS